MALYSKSYNLVNELTGYENIILPIMLDKKKVDEKYIDKIISMLGIEDRLTSFAVCAFGRPAAENCNSKSTCKQAVNPFCRRAYG